MSTRKGELLDAGVRDVRILPMDEKAEFNGRSADDVQHNFFLKELLRPDRPPGKYRYLKAGLRARPGTVVLFQYDRKLIASATLIDAKRFDTPEEGRYRGALFFDPKLVKIFDPIGPEVLARIWPNFKAFGRAKWTLDFKGLAEFERRLTGLETPKFKT